MRKIFIILLLYCSTLLGQSLIERESLIKDLTLLSDIIEQTHPAPYLPFGGKQEFYKTKQDIIRQLPANGLSKVDFCKLLNKFTSKLNDAHTYVSFPEDSGLKEKMKLPVQFGIATDALFIQKSVKRYKNLIGCKLTAVNNLNLDSLVRLIKIYEPFENDYGAYNSIVKYVSDKTLASRLFGLASDVLEFTLIDKNGKTEQLKMPFIYEDSINNFKTNDLENAGPRKNTLFDYRYIDAEKKTALFEFNSTYSREVIEIMKSMKMDYKQTLEMLVGKYGFDVSGSNTDSIRQVPSLTEYFYDLLSDMKNNKSDFLIIDLRRNGGGWFPIVIPTLYMLYGDRYFGHNPMAEYNTRISSLWLAKYKINLEDFNHDNNTSFNLGDMRKGKFMGIDTSKSVTERRESFITSLTIGKRSGVDLLKSQNGEPVYLPKIVIITSPVTFSAAFQYLYFLREIGNAVVVGTPPRQAGNACMETTPFVLEHSGLKGSVSNSQQLLYPDDNVKGKQLVPDYPITYETFVKYGFREDTEVKYVMELIQKSLIKNDLMRFY